MLKITFEYFQSLLFFQANIFQCQTWKEKLNFAAELTKSHAADEVLHLKTVAIVSEIYKRYKNLDTYQPTYKNFKSDIKVFRPVSFIVGNMEDKYGLSQFFQKPVEIRYFEGNHETILENEKLADALNAFINSKM